MLSFKKISILIPVLVFFIGFLHPASASSEADITTNLIKAIRDGSIENVKKEIQSIKDKKIDLGKFINKYLREDNTFLNLAITSFESSTDIIDELLKNGADIDLGYIPPSYNSKTAEKGGINPLIMAAKSGKLEVCKFLIDRGANPNAQSKNGETPLGKAIIAEKPELVEVLLDKGANPNQPMKKITIETPLFFAAQLTESTILDSLIRHGVSLNPNDDPKNKNIDKATTINFQHIIEAGSGYDSIAYDRFSVEEEDKKALVVMSSGVASKILYPDANDKAFYKKITPYQYLEKNYDRTHTHQLDKSLTEFILKTDVAQTLRVLMGQSGGTYSVGTNIATPEQAAVMVRSIYQVAKIGNDLALLNLLNSENDGKTDQFKKHKLAVYLLYRHARKEDPKLEEVRNLHLEGLTRDRLEQYSKVAVTKYGDYLKDREEPLEVS